MIKKILLLLLLAIPLAAAQADDYDLKESLLMHLEFESSVNLVKEAPDGRVMTLDADVSYLPLNDERQKVSNLEVHSNPEAKTNIDGRDLRLSWDNPVASKITYGFSADIETKNEYVKVTSKVKFPLNVDGNELEFTKPTKSIDTNSEIEELANKLSEGKDDEWDVVYSIAEWTRTNIKYDLNTLTATAVQPSSWVLQNKEGVCDEMTNLFISLLRSSGIPARFVSGVVYSNVGNNWGGHGWAEVYFPGYGWVPFDVTFGQYGRLDPSHIKLKDNLDSSAASAKYSWSEQNMKVEVGQIDINTALITADGTKESPITFSLEPLADDVKFGSYVPVQIDIENLENYYTSLQIIITKAPGLTESNVKTIMLKPNEEKSIFWIAKIPADLNEGYTYTGIIEAKDTFGEINSAKISYSADGEMFSEEKAEKIVQSLSRETVKPSNSKLDFQCSTEDRIYYEGEKTQVTCEARNSDSKLLEIEVCMKIECENIQLNPGEAKTLTFDYTLTKSGRIVATALNEKFANYAYIDLKVISVPSLAIRDFSPTDAEYGKKYTFKFTITSSEPIKNLNLGIGNGKLFIDELEDERILTFETNSKYILDGLEITADYQDVNGKEYHHAENLQVNVTNQPWYARILFWIAKLFQ